MLKRRGRQRRHNDTALPSDSCAYHESQIRRTFRNQREMAEYLETMLCRNRKDAV